MGSVHIIGAGISGLSAATMLAEKHIPVRLYEATSHAGGRCRSSHDAVLGPVDHGLHLAERNGAWQAYLTRVGRGEALAPAPSVPLPRAPLLDYLPMLGWLLQPRGTAQDRMPRDSQLQDAWLRPVARLLYGTPPSQWPARAMRHYLRHRRVATMPKGLQHTAIQPALDYLDHCGGSIYFNHALTRLERNPDGQPAQLVFARKKIMLSPDDIVILATPPALAQRLLPELQVPVQDQPSITLHYACAHHEPADSITYPLDSPMDLLRYRAGQIAASIRLAGHCWASDPTWLAQHVWRSIQKQHPYLRDTPLPAYNIQREKRAGHALSALPAVPADHGRLLLAGDWLFPNLPATLEQAAHSGHTAATLAMARLARHGTRDQLHFYLN